MVQGSHVTRHGFRTSTHRRKPEFLYIVLIGTTSLAIVLGLQHAFYRFLAFASVPQLVASGLTGVLNLSWYELGYVIGGGLKNVAVYQVLPLIGGLTGLVSAVALLTGMKYRALLMRLHIVFALAIGLLSLAILIWRLVRGYADAWRMITSISFFMVYLLWGYYSFHGTSRSPDGAGA